MIDRFLNAKHWQLFTLTFGIPALSQFFMMFFMIMNFSDNTDPDPLIMQSYMGVLFLIFIIFASTFYGWFWSVSIGLQKTIPENIKMKIRRFKIFFFIPVVYIFLIMLFFVFFLPDFISNNIEPDIRQMATVFAVIVPLHFLSMFSILHTLYFSAKTFKTAELQREAEFSDFIGEFFMIWFYPIGIWIVQPKINKMINGQYTLK
ncbi:hypothetical protein FUAX_32790 [Fulvitalea axinellae]|uniref:DUF4328 domain-containing protein n=2 Tax=Fulvitalea axinellae TaxID=1182444 RepID=A0AAU9CV07_9BACT|nr:hypothetical protein FUAX_32790 [Fulvitalea axinellae]